MVTNFTYIRDISREVPYVSNSLDAYVPELWAQASLEILFENMVIGNLVHRDFSPVVASYGDTVNTRKPSKYVAVRKTGAEVTVQDSTATNVAVLLNHHAHTTIELKDVEMSYSFKDLVQEFLLPASMSLATYVDKALIARMYGFMSANGVGTHGGLSSSNAKNKILDVRTAQNINLTPVAGRNILWGPTSEGTILQNDQFTQAYSVGDDGTAFAQALIGRKLGYNHYMGQNMPETTSALSTTGVGAINNAAGYVAGSTALTVDGAGSTTTNVAIGSWFSLNGAPYQVVSYGGTVTSVVCTPGLRAACADNDVITWYKPGAINAGAGYTVGTLAAAGALTVDGFTLALQPGQAFTIGAAGGPIYMATGTPTTTSVTPDRPLEATVADDAVIGVVPAGLYNFAFNRNALTLVSRPLALVDGGMGAKSGVASQNGIGMRVTMSYDGRAQSRIITLDMLLGTQILDVDLGAVVFA